MHTAFLTADVKYLAIHESSFMCPDTYCFLHIRGTFRDDVDSVDVFIGNHFGILSLQLVLHFDGYRACRGLILYRTLLFSLLTDTRSIVSDLNGQGLGTGIRPARYRLSGDHLRGLAFSFFFLCLKDIEKFLPCMRT